MNVSDKIPYLVVASLDHEQRGFVVLDAHKERRKRASVLLRRVEQHWLVHGDPHRQPGPQREQLQHSLVTTLNNPFTSFILISKTHIQTLFHLEHWFVQTICMNFLSFWICFYYMFFIINYKNNIPVLNFTCD